MEETEREEGAEKEERQAVADAHAVDGCGEDATLLVKTVPEEMNTKKTTHR